MRQKRIILWRRHLTFDLALAFLLCGCAARVKTVTNLPAGVTQAQVQKWDSAVEDLKTAAASTSSLRQAVMQLNQQGILPDGSAYTAILTDVGKADSLEAQAAVFLQSVPNDWSLPTQTKIQAYMQQIQVLLTDMVNTGAVGIKDATAQTNITSLIKTVGDTVNLIISLTQ